MHSPKTIVTIQENDAGRWEYIVQRGGRLEYGTCATFEVAQEAVKKAVANLSTSKAS